MGRGIWSPSHSMSLGRRPTSLPSGTLIHPAIWPQQIRAENWWEGLSPSGEGQLGLHLTQCGPRAGAYLQAKFHLDPSNPLARIHQPFTQTDTQDRQRSDSIRRKNGRQKSTLTSDCRKFGNCSRKFLRLSEDHLTLAYVPT